MAAVDEGSLIYTAAYHGNVRHLKKLIEARKHKADVLLEAMKGSSWRAALAQVRATSWPSLRSSWRLWPAVNALTYSVVPQPLRVLWMDFIEIGWVAILASCVNTEPAAPAAKAEGRWLYPSLLSHPPFSALLSPLLSPLLSSLLSPLISRLSTHLHPRRWSTCAPSTRRAATRPSGSRGRAPTTAAS